MSNYFSRFDASTYFAGDGARQDDDGDFWLLGRVDDVMNVSGHRLSTIELESALVEHPAVAEAAATAAPDALTGQTPLCFVLLRGGYEPSDALAAELREWIGEKIGKIARPKAVIIVDDLPKTRSGKIMRRLLKDIAEGRDLGDTTTLRDPAVVEELKTEGRRRAGLVALTPHELLAAGDDLVCPRRARQAIWTAVANSSTAKARRSASLDSEFAISSPSFAVAIDASPMMVASRQRIAP